MATKKAGGSSKNARDSNPQFRGLKVGNSQSVLAGNILIRQKGYKYKCGKNTSNGKDCTIFATSNGKVRFYSKCGKTYVSVEV